jgi:hypothetical protein
LRCCADVSVGTKLEPCPLESQLSQHKGFGIAGLRIGKSGDQELGKEAFRKASGVIPTNSAYW